jgi:hypothetical protein
LYASPIVSYKLCFGRSKAALCFNSLSQNSNAARVLTASPFAIEVASDLALAVMGSGGVEPPISAL